MKKALLQILQKPVDLHRIFYIFYWTLHEVISHSPPSAACIVEYCPFSLSSEVRFLENTFRSKLSEHIKCSRYQYVWLTSIQCLNNTFQRLIPIEPGSTATSQNENCDFPSKTLNPGNWMVYCFVTKAGPDHVNFVVISLVPI